MRSIKKRGLLEKIRPTRGRPFTWRKKWRDDWDSVVYCSARCRSVSKTSRKSG